MKATTRLLSAATNNVSRSKSISFIGLGRMGSEMAKNLFSKKLAEESSDYSFYVCDAFPEAARRFRDEFIAQYPAAKNVNIVASPAEAVRASATVVTMLPSSPQVRTVYTEDGGIIPALRSSNAGDTLCIDSTTLDVEVARSVSSEVQQTGAKIVDAPVSGGVIGAKAATLTFLVGGTEESFNLASPILQLMGQRVIHCGPAGAGLGAKICNNLILGVQQIVVAEAMLLAQKLELDPAILASVIGTSTGASWSMSVNNPAPSALPDRNPPCERGYEGGFASSLMLKDMGLATDLGSKFMSPLPLAKAAEDIYQHVIEQQPDAAKKDFSVVYKYLKEQSEQGKNVKMGPIVIE